MGLDFNCGRINTNDEPVYIGLAKIYGILETLEDSQILRVATVVEFLFHTPSI